MRRVRRREMEKLFSREEALMGGRWPVAVRYRVLRGVIHPDDDPGDLAGPLFGTDRPTPWAAPQYDPDAFLSFARLATHGKPSQDAILGWVHRYGLLYRLEPDSRIRTSMDDAEARILGGTEDIGPWLKRLVLNQKPMALEEFRKEARHAYLLLNLYEMLRGQNQRALRERLARDSPDPYRESPQGPFVQELFFGELCLSKKVGDYNLHDHERLPELCRSALYKQIDREIEGVRHTLFGPGGGFHVSCPDVRTAMYWQFACLVAGKRPTGICKVCGSVFVKTRKDKEVCGSGCRSAKSRAQADG